MHTVASWLSVSRGVLLRWRRNGSEGACGTHLEGPRIRCDTRQSRYDLITLKHVILKDIRACFCCVACHLGSTDKVDRHAHMCATQQCWLLVNTGESRIGFHTCHPHASAEAVASVCAHQKGIVNKLLVCMLLVCSCPLQSTIDIAVYSSYQGGALPTRGPAEVCGCDPWKSRAATTAPNRRNCSIILEDIGECHAHCLCRIRAPFLGA
jgi:hypothetical protein